MTDLMDSVPPPLGPSELMKASISWLLPVVVRPAALTVLAAVLRCTVTSLSTVMVRTPDAVAMAVFEGALTFPAAFCAVTV